MQYLGNCIDSFDENGDCVNPFLPFNDATDFAQAVEENDNAVIGNITITYDDDTDIHSFWLN